jgi:hypothetical protein
MKLIFSRDVNEETSVHMTIDGEERAFTYPELINQLLQAGPLEPSETRGTFSQQEIDSINNMVDDINEASSGAEASSSDIESAETEDDAGEEIPF